MFIVLKLFLSPTKYNVRKISSLLKYNNFKLNLKYKQLLLAPLSITDNNKLSCCLLKTSANDEKDRIFTIPNYLTVARIVVTPVISYLMLTQSYAYATTLFLLTGFTDFLDGYIARNFKNQKSHLGSILDPVADKIFIGVMTVTLGACNLLPIDVMLVILARDFALILSALIIRFKLIDKPRSLKRFFNLKQSSVVIEASKISKLNTFLQICLIGSTIPSDLFAYNDSIYLKVLQYLTASTTIISGVQYLLSKGSYKVTQ